MTTLADTAISTGRLSIVRCAAVGAIVLGVLFLLCWLAAALGWLNPSHMYIALFTSAPAGSTGALAIGLCWSIPFGAVAGAVTAFAYNALGFLAR